MLPLAGWLALCLIALVLLGAGWLQLRLGKVSLEAETNLVEAEAYRDDEAGSVTQITEEQVADGSAGET